MNFLGRLSILRASFSAAISEPVKVIAPMTRASAAVMRAKTDSLPLASSIPPTSALARPPMPFSSATVWGISIILTRFAQMRPAMRPAAIAQTAPIRIPSHLAAATAASAFQTVSTIASSMTQTHTRLPATAERTLLCIDRPMSTNAERTALST